MKRLLRNRYFWSVALVLTWLCGVAAYAAWNYRVYSWSDYQILRAMEKECHPAWQDFHFRHIGPGDNLNDVIHKTAPSNVKEYGDFTVLLYRQRGFTGMSATAYKGRLVEAGARSCCWDITWFNILTTDDKELFNQEYEKVMRPLREQWEKEAAEERAIQPQDDNVP